MLPNVNWVELAVKSAELLKRDASVANGTAVAQEYLRTTRYPLAFAISPILLPLLILSLREQKNAPDTKCEFKGEYDFIVVGSGSGGSVVASRLSEAKCVTVLLLEAGKSPPVLTDAPATAPAFYGSDIDWNYRIEKQNKSCWGQNGNRIFWNSGKVLGGSTILNAMFATRGNRKNYDEWEKLGATGWSYKDISKYFYILENSTTKKYRKNGYHATGGPMNLEISRYNDSLKEPLLKAYESLGYKPVDSNAETQTGVYDYEATMKIGQRFSVAKGYLVPAENRTNLNILKEAYVRRILMKGKKAYGVEFDFNGKTRKVNASKEVILCAGAIGSPQLLMLSGIGPKKHLEELHIKVVADLPVGDNLQDHVASPVMLKFNSIKVPPDVANYINPLNQLDYIVNKRNKLAGSFGGPLIGFLNRSRPHSVEDFPDYELYFVYSIGVIDKPQLNIKSDFYATVFGPYIKDSYVLCTSQQLQPKSTGTVRLKSKNPYDQPLIDPKYFSDERDLEDVMAGMRTCRKLCESEPLKKLGCEEFKTIYPTCVDFVDNVTKKIINEEKYLECMARSLTLTIWHKSCTARMGLANDTKAVVTPDLKVKGIDGLRVADGSVMPKVVSGNTNIPIIMIGEKVSEMIKTEHYKVFQCSEYYDGQYGVRINEPSN